MAERIKLAFTGDISLNGEFCKKDKKFLRNVFLQARKLLKENNIDFLITNLESPVEGDGRENLLKNPRIKTTEHALEALKTLLPNVVILGNNHICDCLERGFENTVKWLTDNGMRHTGASRYQEGEPVPFRFAVKGTSFTLLSYVAYDTHPPPPKDSGIRLVMLDPERVIDDIKRYRTDSIVIVSLHWGVEFSHYPSVLQRKMACDFVDAGAGLIIGHHTHTLQGRQIHGKGHIFYSLGNFAFDDVLDIENPALWTEDQQHGGLALITIKDGEIEKSELHITHNTNLTVSFEKNPLWKRKLGRRSEVLKMNIENYRTFWKRYQFMESVVKPPFAYFFGERKNFFKQLSRVRLGDYRKISNYMRTFIKNSKN